MFFRQFILVFALVFSLAGAAHADLDAYLQDLRISARADLGGFQAEVGARFGTPRAQVDIAFGSLDDPAVAAVCLWLSVRSGHPVERVIAQYRTHKGQGWGALAKSLGIKPGSADFKALKAGNLGWNPGGNGNNPDKGQGRGKDKKKEK